MTAPATWFRFRDKSGKTWEVQISTHEDSPILKGEYGTLGYDGITISDERSIIIDAAATRNVQDYIILHELMHAVLDGVNGIDGKAEEKVITEIAPRLYPVLQKFGLRWPERPAVFKTIERKARRTSK